MLLFVLSGCGDFRPIYAHKTGIASEQGLTIVKLKPSPSRAGQILYTALYPHFKSDSDHPAKYVLQASIPDIKRDSLGIAPDGTYQLEQITVEAEFALLHSVTGEEIEVIRLRSVATYDVSLANAYSSESAYHHSQRQLLYDLARRVRLRVVSIIADLEA